MAARGWIVVRPGWPRAYYTVLAGTETWSDNPADAHFFTDCESAEQVAARVGGRAEPVGGTPPDNVRALPRCEAWA